MRTDVLKYNIEKLLKQRSIASIFASLMMLTNIVLSVALLAKDEKVIIIPAELKQSVWLSETKVSKEYLEEMGFFISSLILDISPASSKYQRGILLKHVASSYHNNLKKIMIEEEAIMLKEQFATSFKPIEAEVNDEVLEIKIKGDLITYVGGKNIKQERLIYLLKFDYKLAQLLLKSFKLEESR